MAITVLRPFERKIAGLKKGQAGVAILPGVKTVDLPKFQGGKKDKRTRTRKNGGGGGSGSGGGNGGNGDVSVKIRDAPKPPGFLESLFPPLALYSWSKYGSEVAGYQPVKSITGPPEILAGGGMMPGGGGSNDPFSDAAGSIGQGLKWAGILIPIGLGIMLLSKVKGLFK